MLKVPAPIITRRVSHTDDLQEEERERLDSWLRCASEAIKVSDIELYPRKYSEEFTHRNLQCRLFRNDYLSWCGLVICTEEPLSTTTSSSLRDVIKVHGGLSYPTLNSSNPGHFGFDCCHTLIDSVPYVDFLREHERRVGLPLSSDKGNNAHGAGSYKDYEFAKKELLSLADQLADEQYKRCAVQLSDETLDGGELPASL